RAATEDEYLAFERSSSGRHEYLGGEILAMAGGSPRHAALAMNVGRILGNQLQSRPCVVLSSDARVHIPATGLYTYPDVTVACDKLELHPKDRDVLLNPTLIVEVLSDSTEAYDRGAKFAHYRRIPSLRAYVLVSQGERRIELFERIAGDRWELTERVGEGSLPVPSLGVTLDLAEVYSKIELFEP
ncbi:MAG TPA: Uma2 family endonuclease, partial [Candidatus Nanopelagicales bacterium]|nr:Uma2 family endonuclease [Candidatus Nanopelagicales bacterium]